MKKLILSVGEHRTRLALVEDEKIMELYIRNKKAKELVGNFYKAKIIDKIDGMKTFFVDIGLEKKAFLSLGKMKLDRELFVNDEILVQVDKNPRGEKGASLTLDFSILSRNLILLPNSKILSVSKKIEDQEERERLKNIFSDKKNIGLIIRTSAKNLDSLNIKKEYDELVKKWEKIEKNYQKTKKNGLVYSQNDFTEELFREYFNDDIDELIIDNKNFFEEVKKYVTKENLQNKEKKISIYYKDEDIFDFYGLSVSIENALRKKVWLDSGAYLIIEKTEALISIDVNSGRNIGEKNLRDTILKTNLEAAIEIPRQIRLRNLAGVIIIDFIDMKFESDRKKVLKILEENLKKDREKVEIINVSKLNLVQITRKRQGNELASYYQEVCPHCEGTGLVANEESVILNILKELKEITKDVDIKKIEIKTKKEVIEKIKKDFNIYIKKLLENSLKEVIFLEDKAHINNNYEINLLK